MAAQTLDVSPAGRVEGDLDVRVEVENGVVKHARTTADLFRGFELILRGKDPRAGLDVIPRACGICAASHLTCAAWALDTAWQTEVPRNAILARNIGQLTESLQSQPRYFYGLYATDMTNKKYRNSKFHDEAVKRFAPFTGRSYERGVAVSGKPAGIHHELFGGQGSHSSYMVPGGVLGAPTSSAISRSWSLLEYYKETWLEPVWLGCTLERYEEIESFDDFQQWLDESPAHANSDLGFYWRMGLDIGLEQYGGGVGRYVSWGYLPHEDEYQKPTIDGRNAALIMKSGVYDGKTDTHVLMSPERAPRNTSHVRYDEGAADMHLVGRTPNARNNNAADVHGYSSATAVNHDQLRRLEAGPLARQLVAGGKHGEAWQHYDPFIVDMYKNMGGPSLHLRQIARMHETVNLYRQTERCLREFRLHDPWYLPPKERDGCGWGATEAIRGALCHWIVVKDGKIENYHIVAPTSWNVGPRDSQGIRGPIEAALLGTPVADPTDPVEVGHVARSFDSCLACTVHVHDAKSGQELARFRIG
jgi:hydrogenase large subunit